MEDHSHQSGPTGLVDGLVGWEFIGQSGGSSGTDDLAQSETFWSLKMSS